MTVPKGCHTQPAGVFLVLPFILSFLLITFLKNNWYTMNTFKSFNISYARFT